MCRVASLLCFVLLATFAASNASAAELCGVTDAVLADGFEPTANLPAYAQPGPNTPLSLAVVDPPNGSTTGLDRIVLQGNFTGPPNTGIVAGDRLAAHSDTRFVTPPIALKPGANAIEVQLHTVDGPGPSVVHNITYDPALAPRARLLPATVSAMAPTALAFDVALKPGEPLALTRLRLDTDGNGSTDLDITQPDTAKATYQNPGLTKITGIATLDDTNPNTPAVQVPLSTWFLAQHPQQTRYALCSAFGTMRARLMAGNVEGALSTLAGHLKERFDAYFTALGPQLPDAAENLGTIIDGTYSLGTAELMLTRPMKSAPEKQQAYRVQLERDEHGVWVVTAM